MDPNIVLPLSSTTFHDIKSGVFYLDFLESLFHFCKSLFPKNRTAFSFFGVHKGGGKEFAQGLKASDGFCGGIGKGIEARQIFRRKIVLHQIEFVL